MTVKRLEFLHELLPTAKLAYLVDPTNSIYDDAFRQLLVSAEAHGVQLLMLNATDESSFETAFRDY